MSQINKNSIKGITDITNATDAATKSYINSIGKPTESTILDSGKFLSVFPSGRYWTLRTVNWVNNIQIGPSYYTFIAFGMVYGNNNFVAVGNYGSISASTDGITWTYRTSGVATNQSQFINVAFGNGNYVCVGTNNRITTSTDSIAWTIRTSGVQNQNIQAATYGNGNYVISAVNSSLRVSTDLIVWQSRTSGSSIYSLHYANGYYLAGGIPNSILVSTDTIVWTKRTSGTTPGYGIIDFTYGNNTYIALTNIGISTSTDTIVWTIRTSGVKPDQEIYGYQLVRSIWTGSVFILTAGGYTVSNNIKVSTDAIVWEDVNFSFSYNDYFYALASGNNVIVTSSSDSGRTFTSVEKNQSWQTISSKDTTPPTYKGSVHYTKPGSYEFFLPPKATTFYVEVVSGGGGGGSGNGYQSYGIGAGGGGGSSSYASWLITRDRLKGVSKMFIGVGRGGRGGNCKGISVSTDNGNTWEPTTPGFQYYTVTALTYGNDIYVAASNYPGVLSTSTDAISWTLRTVATYSGIFSEGNNGLYFANNLFFASSYNGLSVSTNGVVWVLRTSGNSQVSHTGVLSADNIYVVGGDNGYVATSTDAITWQIRTSPINNVFILGTYGNGFFLAGSAYNNRIMVSTNAIVWILRTSGITNNNATFSSFSYGNGVYVCGGYGSMEVITSTDTVIWTMRTAISGPYYNSTRALYFSNGLHFLGLSGGNQDGNSLLSSTDGIVWTFRTCLFKGSAIYSIVYGNEKLVTSGNPQSSSYGDQSTVNFGGNQQQAGTSLACPGGTAGSETANSYAGSNLQSPYSDYIFASNASNPTFGYGYFSNSANSVQNSQYQPSGGGGGAYGSFSGGSSTIYYYGNTYTANSVVNVESTGGSIWTARTSGTISILYSVTYGYPYYVAGGDNGTVIVSANGTTWTKRTSGINQAIIEIIYNNNLYIAACGNPANELDGSLIVSTDTITWQKRTTGFGTTAIYALTYGNGVYVIGGLDALNTSTDTIVWNVRTFSSQNVIKSLSYGNGVYVAFFYGNNTPVATSTDSIIWTLRTSGGNVSGGVNSSLLYDNDLFIVGLPFGDIRVSTNAIAWTARTFGSTSDIISFAYINDVYVAGTANGTIKTSTDTIVWLQRTSQFDGIGIQSLTVGNNLFVATGGLGRISTSKAIDVFSQQVDSGINPVLTGSYGSGGAGGSAISQGINSWYPQVSFSNGYGIGSVGFGNGIYVATARYSLATSTDTIVWTLRTFPPSAYVFPAFTYGNNNYVLAGENATIASSTDATIWVIRTSSSSLNFYGLTFGNNLYVASGVNGVIRTSTNTIVWTIRTSGTFNDLEDIIYKNNIYIAGGQNADLRISTDAVTWVARTSALFSGIYGTARIRSLLYDNQYYYAIGADGQVVIAVSTDTIVWSYRTSGASYMTLSNSSCLYNNKDKNYFIGGSGGYLLISTDGIVWKQKQISQSYTPIESMCFGNGKYLVGSSYGNILSASSTEKSFAGPGGNGTGGGGGGGGGYSVQQNRFGVGGDGGDGWVRITWW